MLTNEMLARDYERVLLAIRTLGLMFAEDRPPTFQEAVRVGADAGVSLARLAVAVGLTPDDIRDRADRILR